MNIAIVGMGVAGSYLAARLAGNNNIVGFEKNTRDKFEAVCGWGTCKTYIHELLRKCGLNFDDYLLHEGRHLTIGLGQQQLNIELRGLCTYDKLQLIKDLLQDVDVKYGVNVKEPPTNGKFDLFVDATGFARPLLPRIQNDIFIPCLQYKVKYVNPPFDDFYVQPLEKLSGYLWYFPLGNGYAHVGAGDYFKGHIYALSSFMKKYPGEIINKMGRPIRLTPPTLCLPFHNGNIVGVGESIGTVFPLVGEGIIPSMICSELLIENINDFSMYSRSVLRRFQVFDTFYKLIIKALNGRLKVTSNLLSLLKVYLHMKSNQHRYGLNVTFLDVLRIARSYRALSPRNNNPPRSVPEEILE